jgi:hypothetical protein
LLVCGGRDFKDQFALWTRLDQINASMVIHGAATGADFLAGAWARGRDKHEIAMPAKWYYIGPYAGHLRNEAMLKYDPQLVLACPGHEGTFDMIRAAMFKGIPVERLYGAEQR